MMRWNLRAVPILCTLLLVPAAARAGNCTCVGGLLSVTPTYSVFGTTDTQPTINMQITCNGNANYNIAFSTGNSGNYAVRNLIQAAGDTMNYNIYTDAARTQIWAGTNVFVNNKSGVVTINQPLYLNIPAGQDVAVSGNTYQDTINVTMTPQGGGPNSSCTFTLSETVNSDCQSSNATLNFGNYDPVLANKTTPLDKTGFPQYNCTKNVTASIGLDNGLHFTGTTRAMAGPSSNTLTYDLFSDSGRTLRWTTTAVNVTSTSKNTPLGGALGLPVYGRAFAGQDIVSGSYTDSVTATINY